MLRMSSSTISTFLPSSTRCDVVQRLERAARSRSDIARRRCGAGRTRHGVEQPLERVAPRAARTRRAPRSQRARARRRRRRSSTIGSCRVSGAPLDARRSRPRGRSRRALPSITRQSTSLARQLARAASPSVGEHRLDVGRRRGARRSSSRSGRSAASATSSACARALRRSRAGCASAASTSSIDCSGLATKPIAPESQRALARVVGRDHADRDVARRQVGLQPLEHAPALHVGQEDVERDHRRAGTRASSPARRRRCEVTSPLKPAARAASSSTLANAEVVLDDQQHPVAGLDVVAVVVGLVERGRASSLAASLGRRRRHAPSGDAAARARRSARRPRRAASPAPRRAAGARCATGCSSAAGTA